MITHLYLPVQTVMLHSLQVILYMTYSTSTFTMGHQTKDHTSITWSVTTTSTTSHIMKQVKCMLMVTIFWCDHQYQRQAGNHKARNIAGLKGYENHVQECSWLMFWIPDTSQKVILPPSLDGNLKHSHSTRPLSTTSLKTLMSGVWHKFSQQANR